MLEINMTPSGVDWEKEDTVLVTPAGVVHTSKGDVLKLGCKAYDRDEIIAQVKKPLSKDFIIVDQMWRSRGYDVNIVEKDDPAESYISIVTKEFRANDVESYNKAYGLAKLSESDVKYGTKYKGVVDVADYTYADLPCRIESEVRVYRDHRVGILYRVKYDESENTRYFMIKASEYASVGRYGNPVNNLTSSESEWFANPGVIEILNESDVHKNAIKNTAKTCLIIRGIGMYESGDSLNERHIMCFNGYTTYNFSKEMTEKINNFFGVTSDDEKETFEMFKSRYYGTDSGINSFSRLQDWTLCSKESAETAKKKAKSAEDLWSSINWGPKDKSRAITWERRKTDSGDIIIAAYKTDKTGWRMHKQIAFIYDVKKRTRKVLTNDDGKPKEQVPSLQNCILHNFNLQPEMKYDSKKGCYVAKDTGPYQTIVDGIPIKELFAGTNIDWILSNEKEFGDDLFYLFNDGGYYSSTQKIHKVQEDIREGGRIGVVALCILATTGNVMMEQLLKSRMFRMYFLALASEASQSSIFWDTTKRVVVRKEGCPFPYDSKKKNLKEMLGMSMNQLRTVDKAIEIVEEKRSGYGGSEEKNYHYMYPKFGYVAKVLGVDRLSALDDKLFAEIIEMTKKEAGWGGDIFIVVRQKDNVLEYLKNNTPKERMAIIKEYNTRDEIGKLDDYLRMRKNMKELQEKKPEEDIFDPKDYPNRVGKAVKFIRYMIGMKIDSGWYDRGWCDGTVKDQSEFVGFIKAKYARYATEKGSVQLELNEYGRVAGAIIKMNPLQHMNFLHDEMSQWYAMYNDDSKVEEFKEAAKRVNKYEWSDPEDTGLCIIAPKTPGDIRNEGRILSHCVASYVNPIIAGSHNIMFIRRIDMIDEPYYTLDIDENGNVTEVHGYSNCNMEDADIDAAYKETGREVYNKHFYIKRFLHNWAEAMCGKVKEKSLRSSYGKLDIIA